MSYSNTTEYIIIPKDSYAIIRGCAKCGSKSRFINTNKFRVNANGNRIDIWLIYQCEKCRHTLNLTVLERVSPTEIGGNYNKFLANDMELSKQYGVNKAFFARNKAEIDFDTVEYELKCVNKGAEDSFIIRNPSGVKIRSDKIASELLEVSRSNIKKLIKNGSLEIRTELNGDIIIRKF